jgi:hypothetical protein
MPVKTRLSIKIVSGAIACLMLIAIAWKFGVSANETSSGDLDLELKLSSEKNSYILGEQVRVSFELTNKGPNAVSLTYRPDISTGYLKLWISSDGLHFDEYRNSSWGRFESSGPTLQSGESFKSEALILWNAKPQIPRAGEKKILTDYAFPKPGDYYLNATLVLSDKNRTDGLVQIESQPIQITIEEPTGDDLNVWNRIKNNGDIAFFLQQRDTTTFRDEKSKKVVKEIEEIIRQYPATLLTDQMKSGLAKFREAEEKRNEMLEKAKIKP